MGKLFVPPANSREASDLPLTAGASGPSGASGAGVRVLFIAAWALG